MLSEEDVFGYIAVTLISCVPDHLPLQSSLWFFVLTVTQMFLSTSKASKWNPKIQLCHKHQTLPFWWVKIDWSRGIYLLGSYFSLKNVSCRSFQVYFSSDLHKCVSLLGVVKQSLNENNLMTSPLTFLEERNCFLPDQSRIPLTSFFGYIVLGGFFIHCGVCVGYVPYGNFDCIADY